MLLNVKRPVPTHKGKHPRVSNLWEGGREWRDWPRFQIGQNPALQSKEKGIQGGPFKTLPPPRCLPRLRISPTLQAKSFIPVKCRFCWDDRPASVTPLLPVVWQEGLCGKVSVPGDDSNWEEKGPQGLPPKSHNWALVRICRHHPCPGRCDLRYRMLSLPVWGSHLRSDACSLPPHFHYLSLGNPI